MRRPFRRKPAAAPKKPRPAPKPFNLSASIALVRATLAAPPKRTTIARRPAVGSLLAWWVLPLWCAPTSNVQLKMSRHAPFAVEQLKRRVLSTMLNQAGGSRAASPLPGRPHVRVVVFTSGRPDYDTGRTKLILDRLQRGRHARPANIALEQWREIEPTMRPRELGWLRDDTVEAIDLATWQEPAPPGSGCVLVELYSGEA